MEGRTEKLALPFEFRAVDRDPDRERISIVECGGKSKLPLFARICRATGLPFLVVHDRDAPEGKEPSDGERLLNDRIAEAAGPERTVVLIPDFEGVTGLRGHTRKPEKAWLRFRDLPADEVPTQLNRIVEESVGLAAG